MCHIIRRDVVVTVDSTLSRPIDPSQLLSRQHSANLKKGQTLLRGNMSVSVWFAALRTDVSTFPLSGCFCSSLYCSVGLAHWQKDYSPAGNTHQLAVLNCARLNQPIQIHEIPLQPNPSGSVFKKVAKYQHQLLPACVHTVAHMYCTYKMLHVNSTILFKVYIFSSSHTHSEVGHKFSYYSWI